MSNTAIDKRLITGVNKDMIILLALQGLKPTAIGIKLNCDKSYASRIIKPIKDEIDAYLAYKENPQTLYEYREYQLLNSINKNDIKDASLLQKTTSAGICRTKINEIKGIAPLDSTKCQFTVVYNDNRVMSDSDDKTVDIIPPGY